MTRRRAPRVCPGYADEPCGRATHDGPRCPLHPAGYTHAERQRMNAAVASHRAQHGNSCPGWNRPPHGATDLTADHVTPVSLGGTGGELLVLCRSCNATRGTASH